MQEGRELPADGSNLVQVDLHDPQALLRSAVRKNGPEGRDQKRVPPAGIAGLRISGGANAGDKNLVVQRPHRQDLLPVERPGPHCKLGRRQDQLRAADSHCPNQLRKAEVKADRKADPAPGRIEDADLVSRREGVRLPEAGPVGQIDVEQMRLPVSCQPASVGAEDEAGVVEPLAVPLREAAAHDGDSKAHSPVRHRGSSRSFGSLGIAGKGLGRVGTEKHLRQHGKIGPCLRCLTDHRLRRLEGRLPVGPGFDLAQSKSSRSHGSASHAILLPLSHKDRKKASIKNTKFRLFQRKCG